MSEFSKIVLKLTKRFPGLTVNDIAEATGLNEQNMQYWIKGKKEPNDISMYRIREAYPEIADDINKMLRARRTFKINNTRDEFRRQLIDCMIEHGHTTNDIAERLRCKPETVSRWVNHPSLPITQHLDTFKAIYPEMVEIIDKVYGMTRGKAQNKSHDTICWDCARSCGTNKCSWADHFELVEGCEYIADEGTSYTITKCPQFEPERRQRDNGRVNEEGVTNLSYAILRQWCADYNVALKRLARYEENEYSIMHDITDQYRKALRGKLSAYKYHCRIVNKLDDYYVSHRRTEFARRTVTYHERELNTPFMGLLLGDMSPECFIKRAKKRDENRKMKKEKGKKGRPSNGFSQQKPKREA